MSVAISLSPTDTADAPTTGRQKGARRVSPGQVFNRWTVVSDAGGDHAMAYRWNCVCECGTKRSVLEYSLLYNASQSCGCKSTEKNFQGRMATARERFVGKRFGWLTVTDVLPAEGNRRNFVFVANCACGSNTPKHGRVADLASGKVSSCCGPAPYTEASQRLLLDVLGQLSAGAPHYAPDHRILKVLSERGAYDVTAGAVTPSGIESLDKGVLKGYLDDPRSRRPSHTDEEKSALVRLTMVRGNTVAKVARDAKVAESLLSRWRKQVRDAASLAVPALKRKKQGVG